MMRCTLAVTVLLFAAPLLAQEERLLLPIFTPPVDGAFGAEFHTSATVANLGRSPMSLSGLAFNCAIVLSCNATPGRIDLASERVLRAEELAYNGAPGRFIFVQKGDLEQLSMSLRVHDITRELLNFGTEIPIVRESEFVKDKIVFPFVPGFPYYRNTLRIYAASPVDVLVSAGSQPTTRVSLTGGNSPFEPAYGVFTNFRPGGWQRVTIQVDQGGAGDPVPIWAFITVTNNETQAITTITPRP